MLCLLDRRNVYINLWDGKNLALHWMHFLGKQTVCTTPNFYSSSSCHQKYFVSYCTLKGLCHEIFYLHFFHDFNLNWAPDKQTIKYFRIWFRFSSRYLITKLSPQCATHPGDNKIVLANQKKRTYNKWTVWKVNV